MGKIFVNMRHLHQNELLLICLHGFDVSAP